MDWLIMSVALFCSNYRYHSNDAANCQEQIIECFHYEYKNHLQTPSNSTLKECVDKYIKDKNK